MLQAVFWAPSLLLCRVELDGIIVEGERKLAASQRKILWMGDITTPFWMWAIERAQAAVRAEYESGNTVDLCFIRALKARHEWLDGKISIEEVLRHRGNTRSLSRRAAGRDTRSRKIPGVTPWASGARLAATRCALLVDGPNAHHHIAAYPPGLENTPARIAECDQLEMAILDYFKSCQQKTGEKSHD